jgi:cytosine/adenosine deaminase-related metal-dependent hydrolase
MVDLLAESRALAMNERVPSGRHGQFTPGELVHALAPAGHAALGWPDVGRLRVGDVADLVAVRLDTRRTAGLLPDQALLVAASGDVDTVVVAGRPVVRNGRHLLLECDQSSVAELLRTAIATAWGES